MLAFSNKTYFPQKKKIGPCGGVVAQVLQSAFNVGLSVFPFPYVGELITR